MKKWIENEDLFIKELSQGFKWQLFVAQYLTQQGFDIKIPKLEIRKKIDQIPKFSNTPDLIWQDKIFEVKSRKLKFTSPNNFPYQSIFIDTYNGLEAKIDKPHAYICVSTITCSMICLSIKTKNHWNVIGKKDTTRNIWDLFYKADKSLWVPIERMIREMKILINLKEKKDVLI